jgi:hypothetical protein
MAGSPVKSGNLLPEEGHFSPSVSEHGRGKPCHYYTRACKGIPWYSSEAPSGALSGGQVIMLLDLVCKNLTLTRKKRELPLLSPIVLYCFRFHNVKLDILASNLP